MACFRGTTLFRCFSAQYRRSALVFSVLRVWSGERLPATSKWYASEDTDRRAVLGWGHGHGSNPIQTVEAA